MSYHVDHRPHRGTLNEFVTTPHRTPAYEAIDGQDPGVAATSADGIQNILQRGLPLVPDVLRPSVAVLAGRAVGRFVNLGTWPDMRDAATDLAGLAELPHALLTTRWCHPPTA